MHTCPRRAEGGPLSAGTDQDDYVGGHAGKFYFQHLYEPARHEFAELLNARTVNIGYPGHFYVLPHFMSVIG